MATQLLAMVAWNIPIRKLAIARPVKLLAAAVAVVTALPDRGVGTLSAARIDNRLKRTKDTHIRIS